MNQLQTSNQHVVFGAGLIGCYFGGVLNVLGFNVSLVCRPSFTQKLSSGIRLTDFEEHQATCPQLSVINSDTLLQVEDAPLKAKYLWLTVKCTGVGQALVDMAPFVDKQTVIFCCQNGLGSDQEVKQAFPDNLVLRVMVPFNVVELSTGHYHRSSEGHLTIERYEECSDCVGGLVRALHSELLPVTSSDDMNGLLWAKLQLNLGNSVNALADIPVKAMLEQRKYRKVIALLMKELLQVTDALNIELPKITALSAHKIPLVLGLPDFIFTRVANKMLAIDPKARSSMWWDLSQGKATEIQHINGAIIQHAKALGVSCMANEKVSALIQQLTEHAEVKPSLNPPVSAVTLLNWVTTD